MTWLGLTYDWWRGLHIVSVIFWMAGLLYLPRLFVYHFGAVRDGELDRTLVVQQRRLFRGIMNPAMIAAWVFGILLLFSNASRSGGWIFIHNWVWVVKLGGVVLMTWLHHVYGRARKRFAEGERPHSEKYWRWMNEAPAVLAIVIVLAAAVGLR